MLEEVVNEAMAPNSGLEGVEGTNAQVVARIGTRRR